MVRTLHDVWVSVFLQHVIDELGEIGRFVKCFDVYGISNQSVKVRRTDSWVKLLELVVDAKLVKCFCGIRMYSKDAMCMEQNLVIKLSH